LNKRKIVILILTLLIIINVLCLILLINKKTKTIDEGRMMSSISEEYVQAKSLNVKNPSNISSMDLGGISDVDVLHYTNEYITEFLPNIYEQINNNTSFTQEYFNRKKATIHRYSNIYKYSDFIDLTKTMKECGINFDNYKAVEFISSTHSDEKVIIKCEITYEGEEKINLQLVYVGNEISETKLEN